MKKFILCADGFGRSKDYNRAVLNGCNNGFAKSASLVANGEAFDAAINDILPECPTLCTGVHLNIIDGASLTSCPHITDIKGTFNMNFSKLSKAVKNQEILKEIETEVEAQIEKIKSVTKIYHINSAQNIHLIPEIFNIVYRLAIDYEIPYVRMLNEELYFVPDIKHLLNYKCIANSWKLFKFNRLTDKNKISLKSSGLKTNNYVIGIGYRGLMDSKAVEYGLKTLSDEDGIIVEGIINPCSYLRNINNSHSLEYKMTQDKILEDTIYRMGYDITSHKHV